jgi:glycosyltransferase involved in cell wall biosynthesis
VRLILPAHNEEQTLRTCINTWGSLFPLTVIDSGSTDKTYRIADEEKVPVITLPSGKGRAVYYALRHIESKRDDRLIFVDADIHNPEDVHLERFTEEPYYSSDFVLGIFDCESFLRCTNLVTRPLLDAVDHRLGELVRPITGIWMIDRKLGLDLLEEGHTNSWGIVLQLVLRYYKRFDRLPLQCFVGKVRHSPKPAPELIPMARDLTKIVIEEIVIEEFDGG